MCDILKIINDDIEEYENLCKKYKEPIETVTDINGTRGPNPYGEHACKLKEKQSKEWAKNHKRI